MRISNDQFRNASVWSLSDQQAALSKLQNQISVGKKISDPSDDPVHAARILGLQHAMTHAGQWEKNLQQVGTQLAFEEMTLQRVSEGYDRIRALMVACGNGALTAETRNPLLAEISQVLEGVVGLANSQTPEGIYLFSGFRGDRLPVIRDPTGGYRYGGDSGQQRVALGQGMDLTVNDTGKALFFTLPGVGVQPVSTGDPGNTGTVTGRAQIDTEPEPTHFPYAVRWDTDTTLTVQDGSGQVVQGFAAVPYSDGMVLALPGVTWTLSGVPKAQDRVVLQLEPSPPNSVFAAVEEFIVAMRRGGVPGGEGPARLLYGINRGLEQMEGAQDRLSVAMAALGGRMQQVERQQDLLARSTGLLQGTLSGLQDLDYTRAISDLHYQQFVIEAAQRSFVQTQNLSLFNFLR